MPPEDEARLREHQARLAAVVAELPRRPALSLAELMVPTAIYAINGEDQRNAVFSQGDQLWLFIGVVLAVSTGALLAGIPGALFAVPLTAAASAMVDTFVERRWDPDAAPVAEYHKKNQVHREARKRARLTARLRRGGEGA